VSNEIQNGMHLFARDAEFLDQFVHGHVLDVLEHDRNGHPGAPEDPSAAALAGDAFHCRALGPIEICHGGSSFIVASAGSVLETRLPEQIAQILPRSPPLLLRIAFGNGAGAGPTERNRGSTDQRGSQGPRWAAHSDTVGGMFIAPPRSSRVPRTLPLSRPVPMPTALTCGWRTPKGGRCVSRKRAARFGFRSVNIQLLLLADRTGTNSPERPTGL